LPTHAPKPALEAKMKPQRLVRFGNQRRRQLSDAWSDAPNVNGPLPSSKDYVFAVTCSRSAGMIVSP
jgi:hypothetical protein